MALLIWIAVGTLCVMAKNWYVIGAFALLSLAYAVIEVVREGRKLDKNLPGWRRK